MTANEIAPLFTFKPNTAEQDKSIEAVYAAAKVLAETIVNNVPAKHAQQGILQLGGLVTLCRRESKSSQPKPISRCWFACSLRYAI